MRVARAVATLTAAVAMALAMLVQAIPAAAAVSGFDSRFFGESAFVFIQPGQQNQFAVGFTNTGPTGWVKGGATQVDLAQCCPLNTPSPNSAWAVNWLSSTAYATTTTDFVGPGQVGWFVFTVQAPATAGPGDFRFDGDLVLHSTGADIHREGYFQVATIRAVGAPAKLGCAASPTSIESGSTQKSTITATVQDAAGNTISTDQGRVINLAQFGVQGTLDNAAPATVNGVATATLSPPAAGTTGTDQISASSGNLTGCSVNVTFAGPGAPASLAVNLGATAFQAGAATTTTVSATAKDAAGVTVNVTADTLVTFTVDNTTICNFSVAGGGTSATAQATITNGSNSTPSLTLNVTGTAGNCTVTASATGLTSGSKTLTVFAQGTPAKVVISSNNSPQAITAAGGTGIKVVAEVQDAAGNRQLAQVTTLASVLSGSGCTPASVTTATSDANGQRTFTFTSNTNQTCTDTVSSSTAGVTSATTTIQFTGFGPVDHLALKSSSPSGSFVTAGPVTNKLPANGAASASATICVVDANNNTVTSATDSISFVRTAPATNPATTLITTSPQNAISGCASFTVQSTTNASVTDTYVATDGTRTLPGGTQLTVFTATGP